MTTKTVDRAARDEALEEAAKVADEWVRQCGNREIKHVAAQKYATDAVMDIADNIRALKDTT